ncbi:MAG: hypothetical protein ABEI52_13080, partial [Halobacteriaceae archaeon]
NRYGLTMTRIAASVDQSVMRIPDTVISLQRQRSRINHLARIGNDKPHRPQEALWDSEARPSD